tara:strand:- start:1291 stop:3510 length:2220 start_codon:yes stop_codon:yes gene_type:complete
MQNFEQLQIEEYTKQAYHSYATYVILDRAIPRIEDGLKPVQRRILYAMSELGLKATSKPKKSARTVGDVLGKFHPHGDSACYEAMVLMAQSFSYRYPLVLGQGNWGSIDDPKSFAAMRYTEANLTAYTEVLLSNLNQHTTEWGPNFDGSLKEPLVLPTRLPNLLLNGTSGIAVGMATDIPPHNMKEIGDACIMLLRKPSSSLDDLLAVLPGPDYPTGAEIINGPQELKQIADTGQGQIRQRAVIQESSDQLIITELPYQTTSSKIIKQIADLMLAKRLQSIKNIRDESDEANPVMIVLTLRSSRVPKAEVLALLFSETDLEKTHKININYINTNRKPTTSGILPLLQNWLVFRENTLIKQLKHRLDIVLARLHILEGLLIIFANIDKVIQIIRYHDDPKAELIHVFSLSEEQATAILETKLKQLAKLQEDLLLKEQADLLSEKDKISALLDSSAKRKTLMVSEIKADVKKYGDDRRTRIIERKSSIKVSLKEALPKEPVSIIISSKGWIRAGKSHDFDTNQLVFKSGDKLSTLMKGYSHWPTILFDDLGYAYTLPTHQLPSARGQGDPISKYVTPSGQLTQYTLNAHPDQSVLIASTAGYGFISSIDQISSRNKAGKKVVSLGDASISCVCTISNEATHIALISMQGRILIIAKNDIPNLSKGKGNKLLQIHKKDVEANTDKLAFVVAFTEQCTLVLHAGKRFFKVPPSEHLTYIGTRGQRGTQLPRGFRHVSRVEALK